MAGGAVLESFTVDASTPPGTNPVAPNGSGIVTVTGGQVAAGTTTNVIRTNSLSLNTYTIQIQRSQAVASSTIGDNGVSHFDSAAFDVDANGFVQLNGGGIATTSFDVQANTAPGTDPVVPTAAGVVTVNGAAVANHSVVLETRSRAANAYNVEVQFATTAASTDATKSGVAHFSSGQFSVDANGFVQLAGQGLAIDSFQPDSGTNPVVPNSAGLIVMAGSGSITSVGSLNTLTYQLTGLTNHAVLVGAGTSTITKVGPTATAGQVFQSAGSSADPAFSTATYPSTTTVSQLLYSSATNVVSGLATANRAVITTNATGVPVATALATDGQLIIGSTAGAPAAATLTAGTGITVTNGSNSITVATTAALSAFNSVVVQVFTSNGTYTPTSGMKYCTIEVQAGGAGGGGAAASGATTGAVGGAGGGGGYARKTVTAATIGVSQTVTVGGTANGGAAGSNAGTTGNTSSVGAIVSASGGVAGAASGAASGFSNTQGSNGGVGSSGDFNIHGGAGNPSFQGFFTGIVQLIMSGNGGNSIFGAGAAGQTTSGSQSLTGNAAVTYGGGGGGGISTGSAAAAAGGNGAAGIVIITEYVSV